MDTEKTVLLARVFACCERTTINELKILQAVVHLVTIRATKVVVDLTIDW